MIPSGTSTSTSGTLIPSGCSVCSCNPDPPQPLLVTAGFLAFPTCCLNPNAHHSAHHAVHYAAHHAAHHAALDNVDEEKNDAGGEAVRGR